MPVALVVTHYLPLLRTGTLVTLKLSSLALVFGTALGLVIGLMRTSRLAAVRAPATLYVEIFRSIPILLQLFFVYYALPLILPVNLPKYPAAIIALSLYCSAYMAEVVRTGIEAVAPGQWEAGRSLGMSSASIVRHIVAPQALRVAIPPAISVYVFTIKDSSLASVIGFVELTGSAVAIEQTTYGQGELGVLLVVAGIYFVIAYGLSLVGQFAERRLRS